MAPVARPSAVDSNVDVDVAVAVAAPAAAPAAAAAASRRVPLGQWSHDLYNCCAPPNGFTGCWLAFMCPPCTYGSINGMLSPGADGTWYAG